jgi:hypothetical protein
MLTAALVQLTAALVHVGSQSVEERYSKGVPWCATERTAVLQQRQ